MVETVSEATMVDSEAITEEVALAAILVVFETTLVGLETTMVEADSESVDSAVITEALATTTITMPITVLVCGPDFAYIHGQM